MEPRPGERELHQKGSHGDLAFSKSQSILHPNRCKLKRLSAQPSTLSSSSSPATAKMTRPPKWLTLCLYHLTFMVFLMVILLFLIVILMGGGSSTSEGPEVSSLVQNWKSSSSTNHSNLQGGEEEEEAQTSAQTLVNQRPPLPLVPDVASNWKATSSAELVEEKVVSVVKLVSQVEHPNPSTTTWTQLLVRTLSSSGGPGENNNNSSSAAATAHVSRGDGESFLSKKTNRRDDEGSSSRADGPRKKWTDQSSKEPIRAVNVTNANASTAISASAKTFSQDRLIRFSWPSSSSSSSSSSPSSLVMSEPEKPKQKKPSRTKTVINSLVADPSLNSSSSSMSSSSPSSPPSSSSTSTSDSPPSDPHFSDQGHRQPSEARSWQEWIRQSQGAYDVVHEQPTSIFHGPAFWNSSQPHQLHQLPGSPKSRSTRSACRISEFSCTRGKCVSADKFCDGVDDCGDGSDEPALCTPCNRTYYGEYGVTYSLALNGDTVASILRHGGSSRSRGASSWAPHFVCQLAFIAAGDDFGDLVQIIFDSVNIGTFTSPTHQGCSSGSLEIFEINRPITGGKWCGSGAGFAVYFSEMSAISLTLSLGGRGPAALLPTAAKANNKTWATSSGGGSSSDSVTKWTTKGGDTTVITSAERDGKDVEFEFKIRYRFIRKSLAVVRFGPLASPIERGALVPDTYCSRVLDNCAKTRCRIQSPNYPGLYPRNVSCFYTVLQREIPTCKRVLIQITQREPHKVQFKSAFSPGSASSSSSSTGGSGGVVSNGPAGAAGSIGTSSAYNSIEQSAAAGGADAVLAWGDCRGDRDSLTIYDGTDINDPVLLKLCGGASIPPITSSGPAVLIAFHATPYGNPLDARAAASAAPFPATFRGFELDVGIVIVDSETADYTNQHNCNFIFTSSKDSVGGLEKLSPQEFGGNWIAAKYGKVTSPRHTLPLNTTCRYEFRGSRDEAVWIYYVAYRRDLVKDVKDHKGDNCSTRLRIWDGFDTRNTALLATYCDKELPKLCDHKALENETRLVRACTSDESYISAGSTLVIEQQFMEGTALRPLHYQFNYEFVRRHTSADGGACNRHFNLAETRRRRGWFRTSENVFDFGRGGRSNITCTYTFTLPAAESLYIRIVNSSFGDRPCRTLTDFETGRYVCNETEQSSSSSAWSRSSGAGPAGHVSASIRLKEQVWSGVNMTNHENCICGNSSNNSMYHFTFLGRKVYLTFHADGMKSFDSPENLFVYFEWELKGGGCRGDNRYMRTESGTISLESSFTHGLKDKPPTCDQYPWIIEAREGYSLYLRVPGFTMIESSAAQHQQSLDSHHKFFNSTSPFSGAHNPNPSSNSNSNSIQQSLDSIATSFENRLCPTTKNRIFVYDRNNKRVQKICPATNVQQLTKKTGSVVEIYSEDFYQIHSPLHPPPRARFIIEFIGRELGQYRLHWLEVMSPRRKLSLMAGERGDGGKDSLTSLVALTDIDQTALTAIDEGRLHNFTMTSYDESSSSLNYPTATRSPPASSQTSDGGGGGGSGAHKEKSIGERICKSYCPELQACISESLWCDGEAHCPSSFADEKACDSFWLTVNQLMSPAVYIPVAAAIVSALVCCGTVMLCVFFKRTVLNDGSAKDGADAEIMSYGTASRASRSLDRRLEHLDPHDPIS